MTTAVLALTEQEMDVLRKFFRKDYRYVDNDVFLEASAERTLFENCPRSLPDVSWYFALTNDSYDAMPKEAGSTLMTASKETDMFLCLNYTKKRLYGLKKALSENPSVDEIKEIIGWYKRLVFIEEYITRMNLGLVLAMVSRCHFGRFLERSDLQAEGETALVRAMNKFDVRLGFKFSTYACKAINKALSRFALRIANRKEVSPDDAGIRFDQIGWKDTETERRSSERESFAVEALRSVLKSGDAGLNFTEQTFLQLRFDLDGSQGDTLTLEEAGAQMGVTKERARQVQNTALEKIRKVLDLILQPVSEK